MMTTECKIEIAELKETKAQKFGLEIIYLKYDLDMSVSDGM